MFYICECSKANRIVNNRINKDKCKKKFQIHVFDSFLPLHILKRSKESKC